MQKNFFGTFPLCNCCFCKAYRLYGDKDNAKI
nr:MAG TPA: hypothetical protein [Caudoviricetes sp.]